MNAIDTNVFVYALMRDEPQRHDVALVLLDSLPRDETVILWQVATELGSVVAKRILAGKAHPELLEVTIALRERFQIAIPDSSVLNEGIRIHADHQVSYWDAMLIAAAKRAGVRKLYTEDIQSAPVIEGVQIVNPFQGG